MGNLQDTYWCPAHEVWGEGPGCWYHPHADGLRRGMMWPWGKLYVDYHQAEAPLWLTIQELMAPDDPPTPGARWNPAIIR